MAQLRTADIKGFVYRGGWDVRWDVDGIGKGEGIPGFGVRVYPSGIKAFVLSYRFKGRKRLMRLGRFGADLTVDQARDAARAHRVEIRNGLDPLEERRKAEQGETFADLSRKYLAEYAEKHKKTWRTDKGRLERHIPKGWKARKVAAIRRGDVETLHQRIGIDRPYEANRTLDLLRVMFRLARAWDMVPADTVNPAEGVRKFREHKRKRFVTVEELPALAKAIDAEPNIYARAALWLYLLTGARKRELLAARRADIDWTAKRLRLPDTKAGEEQVIPLSAHAIAIMQAVPAVEKNPYLLPGRKAKSHLVNIDKPWRRVRKAAKAEDVTLHDVTLHDLRRSVGSWMTQSGVDLNVIRDALRHANISTTLTYARLGADPARAAMEDHGKRLMEAAKRTGPVAIGDDE